LDVSTSGALRINFSEKEVWELDETCALDVADKGGHTLDQVGKWMGVTRERIRQIECSALSKLQSSMGDYKDFLLPHCHPWDNL
jgi:DNA-directed RNA polymerase sigma subunit (sigma70/sigma32)